ncbi:sulfite exporter TauE/SafE family protein [Desulfovibrio sp. OttesenSCG-928-A18]|nr:sulfite exporter TauE/SafE family protein [Desulfovibrio sp. OttesenSCG-928-A18]
MTQRIFLKLPMLLIFVLLLGLSAPLGQAAESATDAGAAQGAAAAPAVTEKAPAAPADKAPAAATEEKASRLKVAIDAATKDGKLDHSKPTGFLGIPGAPDPNPILAFGWAIWVGWIFSTVGAFGGVMASVGHISVFGLGEYAASFGKGTPMNKLATDSIRVSNQWLVGCSALISSFKYWTLGRIVLPLGIALGIGSLAGSILTPILSQGKISFRDYVGYFGIFVLGLGCYLLYETTPGARAKKKQAAAAAKAFEEAAKGHVSEGVQTKVKVLSITPSRVRFTFCGVEFSFNTVLPIVGGFIIASVASFLGVGGGFLLVPFLTSISQLPMYLAAGTSAFAVLVGMVTSITTFMTGGTPVYWPLIGIELGGIVLGSWIGPMTAKYLPDVWLKRLFILLAFIVGINYILRGFTPYRLW